MTFDEYVRETKRMYKDRYGVNPTFPIFWDLDSSIQERMMRVGIEARHFQIKDDVELTMILAVCTLIRDKLRRSNAY